jgi:regulation of enolase protein 1 (concanavalin A-like superfamily)
MVSSIRRSIIYISFLLMLFFVNSWAQTSDDFFNDSSPKSFWRFLDPVGDVTLDMTGTNAEFIIPAGTEHDLYKNKHDAPRLLQSVSNSDFEIEVKFESTPGILNQLQGIIVQESDTKYMRFGFYSTNSARFIFAAYVNGSNASNITNPGINIGNDVASYLRVNRTGDNWTYSYSTDGVNYSTVVTSHTQQITVTEVGFYGGNAGSNPNYIASADYFWNTSDTGFMDTDSPGVTPPNITVWYGDNQTFGNKGNPQQFANIMGNVADINGINSLSYKLNGGISNTLNIGPDGKRLLSNGDFNIEIDIADLNDGVNTIEITAEDALSAIATKSVTLNYQSGNIWPLPYTIDYSAISDIEDINQVVNVVDGLWQLTPDGIRTVAAGYDRLLVAGDKTWSTNMEVEVPITVHSATSSSGIGFALGWQGHTGSASPRLDWPLQAIGWVRNPHNNPYLEIYTYPGSQQASQNVSMSLNTKYRLKIRSESINANDSRFKVKFWEDGTQEPSSYNLTADIPTRNGSILMITHRSDVTWGNMTINPIVLNQSPQFTSTPVTSAEEGIQYNYSITASDANVADILNITAPTLPTWLNFSDDGNGNATLTGTPTNLDLGSHNVEIIVSDNNGGTDTQSFTIFVLPSGGSILSSDQFCNDGNLSGFWRIFDPYNTTPAVDFGESDIRVINETLEIELEAGIDHNLWTGANNLAPRILQPAPDTDFEVEVKFLSLPSLRYQLQGIIVQEDDDTFLRFEVFHDGSSVVLFAASIDGNTPNIKVNENLTAVPPYLRVDRNGNDWILKYSDDGNTWNSATSFTQAINVTEVGIHAGNTGSNPPAFIAIADYFWNIDEPFPGCSFLTITSPNGGEDWHVGTSQNITWTSSSITDVKIEISYDNGAVWNVLAQTVDATLGSYTFSVPNNPTTTAIIRISDASNSAVFDISDNPFTISTQPVVPGRGDADLNGIVDILDGVYIIWHWINYIPLSGQALINADVNLDGYVNFNDYLDLVFYIVLGNWNYQFPIYLPTISINFSGATISSGNNVIIPTKLNASENIRSVEMVVEYDPSEMEFQSFNANSTNSYDYNDVINERPGLTRIVFVSRDDFEQTDLGTIQMRKINLGSSSESIISTKYKLNNSLEIEGSKLTVSDNSITDVNDAEKLIADHFELFQNYPNPFNPSTNIKFSIPENGYVSLKIYDMLGKEIRTLISKSLSKGIYNFEWDGMNNAGNKVGSGTYIYRVSAGEFIQAKTMILIK